MPPSDFVPEAGVVFAGATASDSFVADQVFGERGQVGVRDRPGDLGQQRFALGSAAASIAPGASALMNAVLSPAGYQRLRAASWKGDSATEKVVATDTAGNATTVTTALRLHP